MRFRYCHICLYLRVLVAFSSLLVSFTFLYSQNNLKFENLTQGLSNPTIKCIFQDKQGFMWFGTRNGLNRYDGYEIVKYTNDKNDSLSIAGNRIECIFQTCDGKLYIGTNGGLCL